MVSIPLSLEASSETFLGLGPLQHPKAVLYGEQEPILIWSPPASEASSLSVVPVTSTVLSPGHSMLLPYLTCPPGLVCLPITYSSVMRQLKHFFLCEAFPDSHPVSCTREIKHWSSTQHSLCPN